MRVKVAEQAVLGHSAKSRASVGQEVLSHESGQSIARAKPVFPELSRNPRQDPQGSFKGLHP